MRIMPFMKRKKGVQFAGVGLDTGGGGNPYVLPTATANRLGGVKVGSGLTVEEDGTLSASGGGGGSEIDYTTTEKKAGYKFKGSDVYCKLYTVNQSVATSGSVTVASDLGMNDAVIDALYTSDMGVIPYRISATYGSVVFVNLGNTGIQLKDIVLFYIKH